MKPSVAPDSRRLFALCGALIATLAFWNCRSVLGFELLGWDDDINITFNSFLGDPTWARLKWMFTDSSYLRRYVPIGWLGFSGVYACSGLSATGYHAANLLLHVANSVALFVLVRRLLSRWRATSTEDDRWVVGAAAIAAGGWAFHPFRAETVGWASGLFYGMAAFLSLMGVIVYVGTSRWRVPVAAALYLASVLAYPMALGSVAIFVLIDVADVRRSSIRADCAWWRDAAWRRLLLEKLLLLLAAVAVTAGNVTARYTSSEFWAKPPGLNELSLLSRVMRSVYTLVYYVWKPWWPVDLTPAPTQLMQFDPISARTLFAAAVLIGVTVVLWVQPVWRRGPLLLWFGFLALLAPMLGMTEQYYFTCDRYAYLALMVTSVAIGFALSDCPATARSMVAVVSIGVLGLLLTLQRRQLEVWRNTGSVFQRVTVATDNSPYATFMIQRWVKYHAQRGEFEQARAVLAKGAARYPGDRSIVNAGSDLSRYVELRAALKGKAPQPEGYLMAAQLHQQLAMAYVRRGEFREAEEHFEAALALEPALASVRFNYAVAWALQGHASEALHHYLAMERLDAEGLTIASRRRLLSLMAGAYAGARRADLAARCVERALAAKGSDVDDATLRGQLLEYRRAAASPRT